ncbi:F-box protein-like [Dorcoceras hygrometricum]|uniref:F-box protein-like n=1 Tax=Dorcoceras hygrometricum TaxID=472368 RepID=A0A2Z7AFR0_9LAMI|nr:F-box protein-like [Dorcoceras hygrometricum]
MTYESLGSTEPIEAGDFPEWMLFEFLVRLPYEVLFRLKLVSKEWCRMISDTCFARMYVDRISHSKRWILVSSFAKERPTNQFILNNEGCANWLDLLMLPPHQLGVDRFQNIVVGSSNGFLLYGPRSVFPPWRLLNDYIYEICNPVTGQRIILPPSQHRFELVATGFVTQIEDNVLKSYRVVRVEVHHMDLGSIRLNVYSSETRRWEYHTIHDRINFYRWRNPVTLGRTLHWIIDGYRQLAAYDPYDKPDSVRLIPLPSHDVARADIEFKNVLLDQHQGHLRYVEMSLNSSQGHTMYQHWDHLSVWILNDYDSGSWSLQHSVSGDGLMTTSVPLCFHPLDSNVLYIVNNAALLSYNFGTRELKIEDDSRPGYTNRVPYCLYYFLFVIPPWPVFIDPSLF